jgi:cytochrome c oxidase subunit 2
MSIGGLVVWAAVLATAIYVSSARITRARGAGVALIIGGGVIFPVAVLAFLLVFGLSQLPAMRAAAPPDSLQIEITGEQWWWRIRYLPRGREPIELANELWLPVGERVNLRLVSGDVVHSFWVPSLAGKMDLIPGRMNFLPLTATRVGTFRGACAEFCGTSHARMNLLVTVRPRTEFDDWLARQASFASSPQDALARTGSDVFMQRGCVTCHTIRGTLAQGRVGPDLTHVGSRQSLAAGLLTTEPASFARWIAGANHIKPDAQMPAFDNLSDDALAALAAYLAQLR